MKYQSWLYLGLTACLLSGCQIQNVRPHQPPATPAPDRISIYELEARAYEASSAGDWEAAAQTYRELARLVPADPEPWFRLGNLYTQSRQHDLALAAYGEALVRDPHHGKSWHNMGILQLRQAAHSFMALEETAAADDPLQQRARQWLDTIEQMLQQDPDTATTPSQQVLD